jgi:hypothetical protein
VTEYQVLWVPYLGCGLKIIILLQWLHAILNIMLKSFFKF